MEMGPRVTDGFTVAAQFFALGVLWLFIAGVLLSIIEFVKRLVG